MQKIYYVDALSGAGKTYAAIGYALNKARSYKKILFVQPSIRLIEQSLRNCEKQLSGLTTQIKLSAIHSENVHSGLVKSKVIEHLNESSDHGEVLFITHETFLQLPYFNRKKEWEVLIDEIPTVDLDLSLNLPDTHRLFTDHLEIFSDHPFWYRLRAGDKTELIKLSENRNRDEVNAVFRNIASKVISNHWDVHVKKDNWQKLLDGDQVKFGCFALLKPNILSGFNKITIMGAMFKKSLLYHLWSNQDVKFKPNQPIKQKVDSRINAHENGNLLTIKYFLEADWSKHKRDRPGIVEGEEVVVLEFMKRKIIEGMKDQPFLWVANNDVKNHHFDQKNSERISNSPHGLNIYQHVNHVVFLSALNPTLPHSKFLEDVGITSDHIRDAGVHQITYQAVMRGSLRDSGSLEQKTVYVTDRKTADYLNEVFPGSKIEKIPGLEEQKFKRGRPRVGSKSMSSRDRKRRSRHAKGLKSLGKNLSDQCHKNTNNLYGNFVTSWGTTFKSVNDTKGVKLPDSDVEQFINELHRSHRQKYESKDSSLLFCPSIFDPDKSESSSRGAENVVHATGIWLDNDGGDLNHKEFQKIFPDIRMVCCNTWSGGDRYRVFIPTARSMSADEYETITMYIMHELKRSGYFGDVEADWKIDAGYVVKNHGFDLSHLHAASLFYMPCQAENLEDSFFDDHPGELLDPTDWLNAAHVTMPDNLESNVVHLSVDNIGQQKVLQAINTYKDIPSGQEKRNHGFYQLGIKLLKMGLDYSSIERYLTEADYDGSRKKKASVKGVINSLQKMKMKFSEAA